MKFIPLSLQLLLLQIPFAVSKINSISHCMSLIVACFSIKAIVNIATLPFWDILSNKLASDQIQYLSVIICHIGKLLNHLQVVSCSCHWPHSDLFHSIQSFIQLASHLLFSNLNGVLQKDASQGKRTMLFFYAILSHPFWTGKTMERTSNNFKVLGRKAI